MFHSIENCTPLPCVKYIISEYSRELSVKVRSGLARLAKMGYKMGGSPPYGLRRQLLDTKDRPKQILKSGERKCLASEHVTLVPGLRREVAVVRRIFDEFGNGGRSLRAIASDLNRDGIVYMHKVNWDAGAVSRVLHHPSYAGVQVWGRKSEFLGARAEPRPREEWIICPRAFKPIITEELFEQAQNRFANFSHNLSDEELLQRLKAVLAKTGKLSARIVDRSPLCPSASAYRLRFGGMLPAYARLNYQRPEWSAQLASCQWMRLLRRSLIDSFLREFPVQLEEAHKSGRYRSMLRYKRTGLLISIVLALREPSPQAGSYWCVEHPPEERKRLTILSLMNDDNTDHGELLILPRLNYPGKSVRVREGSRWLQGAQTLEKASDLVDLVCNASARRRQRSKVQSVARLSSWFPEREQD
jgi:Recombinase